MWYICDGCDIYVICCVCSDRKQKTKNLVTLPSVTLGKEPLPSAFCPSTQQSCQKMHYQVSLPSASTLALGKAVYTTMCFPALPSARTLALGKEFSKKKNSLPSAVSARHSAKDFSKKKIIYRVPGQEGTRQRIFQKKREKLCRVPS